ncbi:putative ribulose-phosphate 3-epimerase [Helianthus anomalus]
MRPSVALKPGTPTEEVFPVLEGEHHVEMVLVMTLEPGFGGQKFMHDTMNKGLLLLMQLQLQVVFGAPEPAQVLSLRRTSINKAQKTC